LLSSPWFGITRASVHFHLVFALVSTVTTAEVMIVELLSKWFNLFIFKTFPQQTELHLVTDPQLWLLVYHG
jgi:hypothetical protein